MELTDLINEIKEDMPDKIIPGLGLLSIYKALAQVGLIEEEPKEENKDES